MFVISAIHRVLFCKTLKIMQFAACSLILSYLMLLLSAFELTF